MSDITQADPSFERIRLEPHPDYLPTWQVACFSEICIGMLVASGIEHVLIDLDGCLTPAYHHYDIDEKAKPVIAKMIATFKTVNLASNNENDLSGVQDSLGLTNVFTPLLPDGTFLGYKPEAEYFDRIFKELGFPNPSTMLMIGDDPHHDVAGAHRMQIPSMLIDRLDPYGFF